MRTPVKPSIVLCHGIWLDGSSFSKVIPALQARGYEVMAAQYGLDANERDVAIAKQTLGRVSSPSSRSSSDALFGPPNARPLPTCTVEMPLALPGSPSPAGTSSLRATVRSNPSSNDSLRTECVRW